MMPGEQAVATVDLRRLSSGSLWPIMRLLAPDFVEQIEFGRYVRRLLATHRWSVVRVVPHPDAQNLPSKYVFDVYGRPMDADIQRSA
jgi:hypothetical protein